MRTAAQGTTIRLNVVYRNATNAAVDPVDPLLELMLPSGMTHEEGLPLVRESTGQYHYDFVVPVDAPIGEWRGRFTGTIDGYEVLADDRFAVVAPGQASLGETPLVSLVTLKAADGIVNPEAPNPKDAQFTEAILSASALIRAFTGMRFETATGVATPRIFEYDGSGYLDIDEAVSVTGVSSNAGFSWSIPRDLNSDQWVAQPYNREVKLWLRVPEFGEYGMSPEMGFKWNADTLGYREHHRPMQMTVTADWGWPEIPADVQRAAIWTALSLIETSKPYQQESIENYSRTRGGSDAGEAIPERAQVALMPYIIPRV